MHLRSLENRFKSLNLKKVSFFEPLYKHTSMGIGGRAHIFVEPTSKDELLASLRFAKSESIPFYIIGDGTNVIFCDGFIEALVIKISNSFQKFWVREEKDGTCLIRCLSGTRKKDVLRFSVSRGLLGFEFCAGIPGTVGGGVVMNAGTYLGDFSQVVRKIEFLDYELNFKEFGREKLVFDYRRFLSPKFLVLTEVEVSLKRGDKGEVKEKIKNLFRYRKSTQPIFCPTSGSVFKNPPGYSAGELIDKAGMKGYRVGDALVSPVHANFILNVGKARASDVLELICKMKEKVYKTFGVELEEEIEIFGK